MDNLLLSNLLIGITAGWAVLIFSDPYYKIKGFIISLVKGNKIAIFIIEALLPVIFLLIMFLTVMIAMRIRN